MRQPQQKNRMRGRGGRKGPNPMSRTFESNGPDVKIRGTASHIAEKYGSLARDALSSGDNVMAENYLQHAEHYNRIIAAAAAAQSSRNEENASANFGRGPQPNFSGDAGNNDNGRNRNIDDDSDDDDDRSFGGNAGHRGDAQQNRGNQDRQGRNREDQSQESDDDQTAVAEAGEDRPRSEGRGRRRTRREPGVEKANGNGAHASEGGDNGKEAKGDDAKRDISSDASMLPDSILGAGAASTEANAED